MKKKSKGFGTPVQEYSYSIKIETDEAFDFAGDLILARVEIVKGKQRWKGWATTADDTADGYSVTFPATGGDAKQLLKGKRILREQIGKELAERLGVAYSKKGDDYVESVIIGAPLPKET